MTPELAKAALAFLARAELRGAEVPAFSQVCSELQRIAQPSQEPSQAKPDVDQP